MSAPSTEPPLVPLRLPSREQWVLHRLLGDRIERARRSPRTTPPPDPDVKGAFRKVESGSLLYTVPELQRTREYLAAYLQDGLGPDGERQYVVSIVERIDEALAPVGPIPPG